MGQRHPGLPQTEATVVGWHPTRCQHCQPRIRQGSAQAAAEDIVQKAPTAQRHPGDAGIAGRRGYPVADPRHQRGVEARRAPGGIGLVHEIGQQRQQIQYPVG